MPQVPLTIEPGSPDYVLAWARACDAVRRFDGSAGECERCAEALRALAEALRDEGFPPPAARRFLRAIVTTHGAEPGRDVLLVTLADRSLGLGDQ